MNSFSIFFMKVSLNWKKNLQLSFDSYGNQCRRTMGAHFVSVDHRDEGLNWKELLAQPLLNYSQKYISFGLWMNSRSFIIWHWSRGAVSRLSDKGSTNFRVVS